MSGSAHGGLAAASICDIAIKPYRFRMGRALRTARGIFLDRTGWHLVVRCTDGFAGTGDVALWPGFGDSDAEACLTALTHLQARYSPSPWPVAVDAPHSDFAKGQAPLPAEVASAWSQALLDIEAQRLGVPLAQLLCAQAKPSVFVHALVDNALEAQAAVAAGYRTIKVKVGREPVSDEVTRIVALRAAIGPDIGLRLDANGAWPVSVALRAARLLAMVSPEWLEQPVAADDIAGMAEVRRLGGVRIAADESVSGQTSLDAVIAQSAADVIVVKPMFAGSLHKAMQLGCHAQAKGLEVCVTHALESAVGRLGALHVALALGCTTPCGLGGALAEAGGEMPPVTRGEMRPFAAPGLGMASLPSAPQSAAPPPC